MKASLKGSYQQGKTFLHVNLDIIIFTEGNSIIVYCPPLDLTGYGLTEPEARQSFEIVLSEYFRYTLNKNTLKEDLLKMGWKLRSRFKPMEPPTLQKVLRENDNFSRIFNSYDFRKTVTQIELPAIA
jgi:hypothetical protein